jgi:hypothetical protein
MRGKELGLLWDFKTVLLDYISTSEWTFWLL